MTLALLDEAVAAGTRVERACEELGVKPRTAQRWRAAPLGEDARLLGPRCPPPNRLSDAERRELLRVANSADYCDLPPNQIVPLLADEGRYVASESTFRRVLAAEGQDAHRGRAKPPEPRPRPEHVATAPNQLWSWDITYLRGPVRGRFLYLYLIVDVWSRRIMGWALHDEESMLFASQLIRAACAANGVDPAGIVLHSDNGGPMKGSTMLATLQQLGIVPSFSRPRVSDDNAYSEALFRTLKYRPGFPPRSFASIDDARAWVDAFVRWYNTEHRHSGIRFVTPDDRHYRREGRVLARRHALYQLARRRHPERWSRDTRNWSAIGDVRLNAASQHQEHSRHAA